LNRTRLKQILWWCRLVDMGDRRMRRTLMVGALGLIAMVIAGTWVGAQSPRVASPEGTASTDIRGKWIEITSGRPIKRNRDLWGSGANYGRALLSGSSVWRAGANVSTRLKTEVPLDINGKTVPAGEYSVFIDVKPANWTLIVSRWGARKDAEVADPN